MEKTSPKSTHDRPARTIAVGDIHGCSTALAALVAAIAPCLEDVVITLGDYVNRGPDTRGAIEQLLELGDRCRFIPLLGNHEEMLLAVLEGRSNLDSLLMVGGDRTLESYGGESLTAIPSRHRNFLDGCRRYYETDSHIFVHAGCWPNLPLQDQPAMALLWERLEPEWVARHYSGKTVVVGHTRQKDGHILDLGFLVCIDTNCCDGGWLTALDVETGKFWQANQQAEVRQGKLGP